MSEELTPKQFITAAYLAQGWTHNRICQRVDVCPDTITRWKQIPQFMDEVKRAQQDNLEALRFKLSHLTDACVNALWAELEDNRGAKRAEVAFALIKMLGVENVLVPAQKTLEINVSANATLEHSV